MNDKPEITFLKKLLEQYRVNVHIILESTTNFEYIDKGIRKYLGLNNLYDVTIDLMKAQLTPNTIYKISDDFFSNYFMMQIPNDKELCYLIVGPYTEKGFNKLNLLSLFDDYKVPLNVQESLISYYLTIPSIEDVSAILSIITAFYETVWGSCNDYIIKEVHHNLIHKYTQEPPDTIIKNIIEENDIRFKMESIEERYQIEASLIKYVSQGNYHKANAILSGISNTLMETRANTQLRDYKNYCIVLNTLLRKGAESGFVHPIHIDKLSSYFAKKIESIFSYEQGNLLVSEMIRKYCFLVKNHSLKEYSLLVRKVVTRIESNLTADQTLKTHAEILKVHPSYLSSIFRKETGLTLTEFVNQKRVEYGLFLLNTTNMQIQMIAQHCGIPNLTYFERIFKKQIGKSPSEYRKTLHSK